MYPLKQSTSIDVVFFAFDSSGDGVTGKVDGDFTKRISKNGAAFAAMTVTVTERENGFYVITLSSSHTDTLGVLTVSLSASGIKRVNLQFRVHARLPDDLATQASLDTLDDYVDTEVGTLITRLGTPSDLGSGATVAGNLVDIEGQTDDIGAAGAGLTAIPYTGPTAAQNRAEMDSNSTKLAAIVADTNELQTDWADGGRLDLLVDAILDDTGTSGVVLSSTTANQVADATLDRSNGVETSITPRQALRAILSFVAGTSTGAGTNTLAFSNPSGGTTRVTMTVNATTGERSAVVLNV